jgi:CHAT domain-containing protein
VNSTDKHLTIDQIDWLVAHKRVETVGGESQRLFEEVRRHLAGCKECQRIVHMHLKFEGDLKELQVRGAENPSKDCPPIESLREVVVGIKSGHEAEKMLDHASFCDYCGPLLRRATKDLAAELTSEEASFLAQLSSAQPAFQNELAGQLAARQSLSAVRVPSALRLAPSKPKPKLKMHRWVYAAAAGLLIVVLASSWLVFGPRRNSVDGLIAQAYSEQRSLELRIPGASEAPIRQQRGAEGSSLSKPAALLEAELLIKRQLERTPNDPRWLSAKGRSELLEWQYEDAIRSFERVLEANPDSPDGLRDLATAHFQRAEVEHRPIDYGNAIEELSKALSEQPDDPVSLFNRAIVYERMFLYGNAAKDWDAYLRVDPAGAWSTEARQHLEQIKKKLQKHNQSNESPIEDPSTAETYLDRRVKEESPLQPEINSIDEQYLDLAGEKWLFALAEDVRQGKSIQQSKSGRALKSLSQLWETRHGDPWLSDLLKSVNLRGFPDAVEALSGAVTANASGNPSLAHQQADLALHLFERLPDRAGVLRAKLEMVYALQRSLEGEKCLQSARFLAAELKDLSYYWIQAKLFLEQSACFGSTAQMANAESYVQRSEDIARKRSFQVLYLRGVSFESDFAANRGDRSLAWKRAQQGLERFWSGSFPVIRGYALCAGLGYLAEDSGHAWVAIASWSEAVPLIEKTANRSTEGLARFQLGTEELAVGRKAEAGQELERAARIFSSLPSSPTVLNYRVASEVSLAAIELSLGERASARARLDEVGLYVPHVEQYQTVLQYYGILAEEQIGEGDGQAAEKNLNAAVAIGQRGLSTLRNEADRLKWDMQTSDAYRNLVRILISQQERQAQALRVWEWYRSMPFLTTSNTLSPSSTLAELAARPPHPGEAKINSLLPKLTRVTFLTYAQLKDGIALWAYDDRGITFRRISASVEEISTVSNRFIRLCSDPRSDTKLLQEDAKKLYGWLISPVEHLLSPSRTLWIEPDGILSLISFQALVNLDGDYLLKKSPIVYRSAATINQQAQEPRVGMGDRTLVVSSSLLSSQSSHRLPPLRDALREAETVATRFPNHKLLLDEEAEKGVIRNEFRRAVLFHYAGHYTPTGDARLGELGSLFSYGQPDNSDSSVSAGFSLSRCKLVVLSACSTGSGEKLGLFDPGGLVRPFLRSGARRVVATRWNVDSRVTAELMDNFYSAVLSGHTTPEALRTASLRLASDPQYEHPYYWAGFGVFAQN